MSRTQTDLRVFEGERDTEGDRDEPGEQTAADAPPWTPTTDTRGCARCGAWVSPTLRRVAGDEDGRVRRCPECSTNNYWLRAASDSDIERHYGGHAGGSL